MAENNDKYDLNGVSYDSYERRARREYELEPHHRESIKEINKKIRDNGYKNPQDARDHLEYLEDLIEMVSNTIRAEEQVGMSNLSLKRDFTEIRKCYNSLLKVLNRLEGH